MYKLYIIIYESFYSNFIFSSPAFHFKEPLYVMKRMLLYVSYMFPLNILIVTIIIHNKTAIK